MMRKSKKKKVKKMLFDPDFVENVIEEKSITQSKEDELYQLKRRLRER